MGSRIVLDSNVLVSALGWRGPSMTLVRHCVEKKYQLLLSPAILEEIERVLNYPKFRFSEREISDYLHLLQQTAKLVEPDFELSVIDKDPSDDRILKCALAGKADAIVSGDRHLTALGSFRDIPIVPPRPAGRPGGDPAAPRRDGREPERLARVIGTVVATVRYEGHAIVGIVDAVERAVVAGIVDEVTFVLPLPVEEW